MQAISVFWRPGLAFDNMVDVLCLILADVEAIVYRRRRRLARQSCPAASRRSVEVARLSRRLQHGKKVGDETSDLCLLEGEARKNVQAERSAGWSNVSRGGTAERESEGEVKLRWEWKWKWKLRWHTEPRPAHV